MNHFELFNITIRFDIDPADLEHRYIEAQRNAVGHDVYNINQAYTALRDDISRGQYILKIFGQETQHMDKDFLELIMVLRDGVSKNDKDSALKIESLYTSSKEKIAGVINKSNAVSFAQEFTKFIYLHRIIAHVTH